MKPIQPTPDQPTPSAAPRALNDMADELANVNPDQELTNRARIALALRATPSEAPGTFDAVLVQTAPIELPMTRSAYAARLRESAGAA